MGEQVQSASATPYRAVVAAAGDHWVPFRITSMAIALSVAVLLLGMAPGVAASSSR
jgi:hypothetical protein